MIAIDVQDVSKRFRLYRDRPGSVKEIFTKFGRPKYEDFWAVRDVSLEIEAGTVHAFVGHNGCGKSSLLRMIAGIHSPTRGRVVTSGRISALLELGAGFHPELTGRENIYLNASILGLSRKQTDSLFDRIVEFSELQEFIDSPVKHYSSGMFVRLGFSVAVHVDPQILLVDEVIAVGDEEFQRRCLDHLQGLRSQGVTIVLVTHAMSIVQSMCDSATWMDHGRAIVSGSPTEVVGAYLEGVNDREAERDRVDSGAIGLGTEDRQRPLWLESISACDPSSGEPTAFAVSGRPLDIRIDWTTTVDLDHPHFVVQIETPSGLQLSTAVSPELSRDRQRAGQWSAHCRFDSIPLAPGEYVVRVSAVDWRSNDIIHAVDSVRIPVRASAAFEGGLISMPAEWSVERRTDGVTRA